MNPRTENPLLLLAAVREKLTATVLAKNLYDHEPKIFFMVDDTEGQYFISAPAGKLYYDEDPSDGHFGNTDRKVSDLLPNVVGVVVKWHGGMKEFHTVEDLSAWAFSD